jgi:threonine dehydrogenase-like Zn-dependent dehydrogenase
VTASKAAFLHGPGDLRVRTVEVPEPGPGEALVAVKAVGICGSDVECFEGLSQEGRYDIAPYIPGHEWAGVVEAVGPGVHALKPGEKVTGDCVQDCGVCESCKAGLMPSACLNMKEMGFRPDSWGGLSQYLVIDERFAHAFPQEWSYDLGALVEPFSVGYFGIWGNGGYVDASDTVVILGAGMIGLCALIVAKASHARTIVVEPLALRAALAAKYGADHVVDPSDGTVAEHVRELTRGRGGSVIVEASGNDLAIASVFDVAGNSARVRLIGHSIGRKVAVEIGQTLWKTLSITGSGGCKTFLPQTIRFMDRLYGEVEFEELISHRYDFSELDAAFQRAINDKAEALKVMVRM